MNHERTPRLSKWLLRFIVGYILFPFDLIPDFIPVLGYADDIAIVLIVSYISFRMIPREVIEECRRNCA